MAILIQRAILKNKSNFSHNFINITGCFQVQIYGKHAHVGITKYDFHPLRLFFYTILTLMTSQMAILLQRTILKNESKLFHNSTHIIGCCQVQYDGNHVYLSSTTNNFRLRGIFLHYFDPDDVTSGHIGRNIHRRCLGMLPFDFSCSKYNI